MGPVDTLYERLVLQLLHTPSVAEIRQVIQNSPDIDLARLARMLERFSSDYGEQGHEAERRLVLYVQRALADLLPHAAPSANLISTSEGLVQAALLATNPWRSFCMLRAHRNLITTDLFPLVENRYILDRSRRLGESEAGALVFCLMALVLGDRVRIARGYLFWGSACRRQGRFQNALRHAAKTLSMAEQSGDSFLALGAISLNAGVYDQTNRVAEAVKLYQYGVETAERAGDAIVAFSLREHLAACYRTLGDPYSALRQAREALTYARANKLTPWEIRLLNLCGLVEEDLGRYEAGELAYEEAAGLAQTSGEHDQHFQALTNSAASAIKRGDLKEGIRRYRAVQRKVHRWGNPVMDASTHNNLGTALLQAGQLAEANDEYIAALRTTINTPGLARSESLSALGLGDSARKMGDYQTADTWYTLAVLPYLESGDVEILADLVLRAPNAESLATLATDAVLHDAIDKARRAYLVPYELALTLVLIKRKEDRGEVDNAVQLCRDTLADCHKRSIEGVLVRRVTIQLARLLGKSPEKRPEAIDLLQRELTEIESLAQGAVLDQTRAEIVSEWIDLYSALIEVLLNEEIRAKPTGGGQQVRQAFDLHEAAKARTFAAQLSKASLARPVHVPPMLYERETQLLALRREVQHGAGNATLPERAKQLSQLEQTLETCWHEMRAHAPAYVELRRGEPATLDDLQRVLAKETEPIACVSYYCGEDDTTCFIVRSDDQKVRCLRLKVGASRISEAVHRLQRAFNGDLGEFPPYPPIRRSHPEDRDLSFFDDLSAELLSFIPEVEGIEHLCIVPHGPLHLLPLHALRLPTGRYLAAEKALTYAPSITSLRYCLSRRDNQLRPGTLRKPVAYVAGVSARSDTHPDYFEQDSRLFQPQDWDLSVDVGPFAATKARVLNQVGERDVIQLTCHGYFDTRDPLNSGLLLADGRERPPRDPLELPFMMRGNYILTARELLERHLRAELVTLRACSTGLQGSRNGGDEFDGLSRALLLAGASAVIVSLWNVDQQSSLRFLEYYYRAWMAPGPRLQKWRAFWLAQRALLTDAGEAFLHHPYHWAPFVLIGDWR